MKSVYILERRINKARIMHLTSLAKQSGLFDVVSNVQHAELILASESSESEVTEFLIKKKNMNLEDVQNQSFPTFVNLSWLFVCLKEKALVPTKPYQLSPSEKICDKLTFGEKRDNIDKNCPIPNKKLLKEDTNFCTVAKYSCQLAAPLNHRNKRFCDALELLELHAIYRGDQNAEARALAFRRGSASLKSFNTEITNENDLQNLPYIGLTTSSKAGHCKKVIVDILSEGYCDEVESVAHSEFFQTMKWFCGIFGVGPVTARKWYYDFHLRTLNDVKASKINLTQDQIYGLQHYEDLNTPVTIDEANYMLQLIESTCKNIDKKLTVTLTGGFRRGKSVGHDVDLLICQPDCVKKKVLVEIISALKDHFIYTDRKTTFTEEGLQKQSKSIAIDHFDKCFSIFKFKSDWIKPVTNYVKPWKAIRVDLVVIPKEQYAFALLGWTGTKHFEREIRRYARTEKQMALTSHGMYLLDTKEHIPASSEEEIFEKLDLIFRKPSERCF